ncbi:hypothetical protein CGLO_15248 [Colletotrichum gloeosporioides Cg-14]|jgi:hypothetical protein
MLSC